MSTRQSKMLLIVLGVFLVLTGFAQICEASQIPKVVAPARIEVQSGAVVREAAKPTLHLGVTETSETEIKGVSPLLRNKGILTVNQGHAVFIQQQFLAANPNDDDGDGIPNNRDLTCPQSPRQLVMLTKAQQSGVNDYIFTVDEDQGLGSDVSVNNFLLRYIRFGEVIATLRSPYNPAQIGTSMSGYSCLWPPAGDDYRDVSVHNDEWRRLNTLCGNVVARWIYHDEVTDSMIFQFMNLVQIPHQCIHPDPGPYKDPSIYQPIMRDIMDRPECQDLKYDWTRFSQIAYERAAEQNYPVGCTIPYPIEPYTGPQPPVL